MAVHSRRGVNNPFASGSGGRGITYSNPRAGAGLPTYHNGSPRTHHNGGGLCGLRNALLLLVVGCATLYSFSGPSQAPPVTSLSEIYAGSSTAGNSQQMQRETAGLRGGKSSSSNNFGRDTSNKYANTLDVTTPKDVPKIHRPMDVFPAGHQEDEEHHDEGHTDFADRGDSREDATSHHDGDPTEEDEENNSRASNGGTEDAGEDKNNNNNNNNNNNSNNNNNNKSRGINDHGGTATQDADNAFADGTEAQVEEDGTSAAKPIGVESDGEVPVADGVMLQQQVAMPPIDPNSHVVNNVEDKENSIADAPVDESVVVGEMNAAAADVDQEDLALQRHIGDDNVAANGGHSKTLEDVGEINAVADVEDGKNTLLAGANETANHTSVVVDENIIVELENSTQVVNETSTETKLTLLVGAAEVDAGEAVDANGEVQSEHNHDELRLPPATELADEKFMPVVDANTTEMVAADDVDSNATVHQNLTEQIVGNETIVSEDASSSAAEQHNLTDQNGDAMSNDANSNVTDSINNVTDHTTEMKNNVNDTDVELQTQKEQDTSEGENNKGKDEPWKQEQGAVLMQLIQNNNNDADKRKVAEDKSANGENPKTINQQQEVDAQGVEGNGDTETADKKEPKLDQDEPDTNKPGKSGEETVKKDGEQQDDEAIVKKFAETAALEGEQEKAAEDGKSVTKGGDVKGDAKEDNKDKDPSAVDEKPEKAVEEKQSVKEGGNVAGDAKEDNTDKGTSAVDGKVEVAGNGEKDQKGENDAKQVGDGQDVKPAEQDGKDAAPVADGKKEKPGDEETTDKKDEADDKKRKRKNRKKGEDLKDDKDDGKPEEVVQAKKDVRKENKAGKDEGKPTVDAKDVTEDPKADNNQRKPDVDGKEDKRAKSKDKDGGGEAKNENDQSEAKNTGKDQKGEDKVEEKGEDKPEDGAKAAEKENSEDKQEKKRQKRKRNKRKDKGVVKEYLR